MSLDRFTDFLNNLSPQPLQVLNSSIPRNSYLEIDLSIDNEALSKIDVSSSLTLGNYINSQLQTKNAKVGFGGYLEHRAIYDRSLYFKSSNDSSSRTIHLGIDIWVEAATEIYAPLNGIIHSFKNNINYGDYGPTIILKHKIDKIVFYSLYGHLSLDSIIDKQKGQEIKQGEAFASLGDPKVNGDYPPHLHFQIIKDIQHYEGDYPGVSSIGDIEFYKENCPNPNLLLKF